MLPLLVFIMLILSHISEQCSAGKDNPQQPHQPHQAQHRRPPPKKPRQGSSLCLSCEDFLTEFKLAVPQKIDTALDGTRKAARDYLPFYSYMDSAIVDFFAGCVQSGSKRVFEYIDPRRECTRLMLC
ncbi:hypothetical protein OESDEN_08928 [Oesophagostomum dentatum]|uniref:Saposin B-type domain-containing protein n=1 Tax=Oesophagostomum dentatum TaxID=61180 RepID=A0A0B1T766_OESDE|nr:hypothetical protein OESDEN_08928 [Oesophagostomum dentatum]